MNFSILHLNVERNEHTDKVIGLLKEKKPHIVCFLEAMHKDVKLIASNLGYNFSFAPLLIIKGDDGNDEMGGAILSKYEIIDTKKYYYVDESSEDLLVRTVEDLRMKNGGRSRERFSFKYTLLASSLQLNNKQNITIVTTHFPVTDHYTPGYDSHEMKDFQNVDDIERGADYFNKMIDIIHFIKRPIVFTADLNNSRGENLYDTLAHELVDRVPPLDSSLDSKLHRAQGLKLMVDTIMTSPDVSVQNFEVIEGVSDHKAFLATLNI